MAIYTASYTDPPDPSGQSFNGTPLTHFIYTEVGGSCPVETVYYLNAAYRVTLPPGTNVYRWWTTDLPDPGYAHAGIPIIELADFWIEDVVRR